MSLPEKGAAAGQSFKSYRPSEWGTFLSKQQKKEHEHTRCRGFTSDEIKRLMRFGLWDHPKSPPVMSTIDAALVVARRISA